MIRPSKIVARGTAQEFFLRSSGGGDYLTLDLGCGDGAFGKSIQNQRYRIVGIDKDECDLSYDPLPFADELFDTVTAWEVLEHLENPWHCIREVKRVLRPNGRFLFSVPNPSCFESRLKFLGFGELPRWTLENDHRLIFTEHIIQKTFLPYFKLIEKRYAVNKFGGKKRLIGRISKLIMRRFPENRLWSIFLMYAMEK